jgi:hypothetical protein
MFGFRERIFIQELMTIYFGFNRVEGFSENWEELISTLMGSAGQCFFKLSTNFWMR